MTRATPSSWLLLITSITSTTSSEMGMFLIFSWADAMSTTLVFTLTHSLSYYYENWLLHCSVREGATFSAKVISKRIQPGQRSSVEDMGLIFHVHVRSNGLASAALCDKEYPSRVAFTLLAKIQEDFMAAHQESVWKTTRKPVKLHSLDATIEKYQNPQEADSIMRIQQDLDETKVILYRTIDSVLERGVKLESLVEKSNDLSVQSKMFYKTARKNNSCCGMMWLAFTQATYYWKQPGMTLNVNATTSDDLFLVVDTSQIVRSGVIDLT